MKEKIDRINELYHKSKKEGLNDEEKNRQNYEKNILTQ